MNVIVKCICIIHTRISNKRCMWQPNLRTDYRVSSHKIKRCVLPLRLCHRCRDIGCHAAFCSLNVISRKWKCINGNIGIKHDPILRILKLSSFDSLTIHVQANLCMVSRIAILTCISNIPILFTRKQYVKLNIESVLYITRHPLKFTRIYYSSKHKVYHFVLVHKRGTRAMTHMSSRTQFYLKQSRLAAWANCDKQSRSTLENAQVSNPLGRNVRSV